MCFPDIPVHKEEGKEPRGSWGSGSSLPPSPSPHFRHRDAGQPSHLMRGETEAQRGVDLIRVIQLARGGAGT